MSTERNGEAEQVPATLPSSPAGWRWTTLGELLDGIESGKSFQCSQQQAALTEWGVIKVSAMTWGEFDEEENKAIPLDKEIEERHEIRPGDLLLSRCNTVELVGATVLVRNCRPKLLLSDKSMRLLVPTEIHRGWLQKILSSPPVRKQLSAVATGSSNSMRNVSQEKVLAVRLPLPPAAEQLRIVAKIEELFSELDAGVAALKRIRANLKRYRAAVLKAAVEGRLTEAWRAKHPKTELASKLLERILAERRQKWEEDQLAKFAAADKPPPNGWREKYVEPAGPDTSGLPALPKGWCWAKLDQLLVYLRNGYFQSPSGAAEGTPILRINAVRPMSVDLSEARFLDKINGDVNDFFIEDGDLLFTRYNGSIDLLGVAGMVRGCCGKILHPDKLIRVKLAIGQPLSDFVEIAANVGASRKHMAGRARTTAGQTGISGTDIREMPVPLPTLEEQADIVVEVAERLSIIAAAQAQVEANLKRAARLRQSILKRAFEGKLVPQDPSDEPADKLMERIRGARETASRDAGDGKGRRRREK